MKTKLSITIILVFCISIVHSQDTILLLTGKTFYGQITEITNNYIRIRTEGFHINKSKLLYNDELFSYNKNNKENILYKIDSINGSGLNQIEMGYFIKGLQSGRKNYHAPLATLGGFAAGITGGAFGFWGSIIPSSYVFITGIRTPHVNTTFPCTDNISIPENPTNLNYGLKYTSSINVTSNNENIYSSFYESGYRASAKDKKIKNSIKGSVIGFAAFIAASLIFLHK
ncbi:MAG: hypothetical protein HY951_14185 [Bacteroidia bacterium]|nr:hypothetical protein [Bacteroidia bacterium]